MYFMLWATHFNLVIDLPIFHDFHLFHMSWIVNLVTRAYHNSSPRKDAFPCVPVKTCGFYFAFIEHFPREPTGTFPYVVRKYEVPKN